MTDLFSTESGCEMIRTGLFHIVVWARLDEFHKRGWMVTSVLGEYSCLCWHCECGEVQS